MNMEVIRYSIVLLASMGGTAAVTGFLIFSPDVSIEFKHYLESIIFSSIILCLLTFLIDMFFLPVIKRLKGSMKSRGILYPVLAETWALVACAGLFAALKTVPYAGELLLWLSWLILTVPLRIYRHVTKHNPGSIDLLTLLSVKSEMAFDAVRLFASPYIIFMSFLPNIITAVCFVSLRSYFGEYLQPVKADVLWRVLVFSIGILCTVLYYFYPRGNGALCDSLTVSLFTFCSTISCLKGYFLARGPFSSETMQANPNDNVVLVIEESIRGDYLSINNPKLYTTATLGDYIKNYPDNVFNYGIAVSSGNGSFISRSSLFSGLNHLPDEKLRTFKAPTLFDIAKANGYRTILMHIPGNMPDLVMRQSDLDRIDEVYLNDEAFNSYGKDPDFNAACFVHDRLKKEKGLFIILIRIGIHFPYESHYPSDNPEYILYTPKLEKGEWITLDKRQKIINSYKNCISYNVDAFVKYLIGEDPRELQNCTVIYTSDHGESLMEYGQVEGHNTRYLEQALVPFVIFSTNSWVLEHLKHPDELKCTLSHMNIAPTLQSIFCHDLNHSSGEYDSLVTSKPFRKPPLVHLNGGDIWSGRVEQVETDENGKIILPLEKYMY